MSAPPCQCPRCRCPFPSKPGVIIDWRLVCWRCKKNCYPKKAR